MSYMNLKGTLYAVRAALPHLIESGRADIVTVASEAGRRGLPFEAVYCASKFGQVGFTRALDHELREHGVRCTNVCPGGVATDFALEPGRGRTRDVLPGMMTADDVAEVVLFVLTRPRNHRLVIPPAHASEKVDLIAVASRDQARAREYAQEWRIERSYGSYGALLQDPDVEAVYISLPNSL